MFTYFYMYACMIYMLACFSCSLGPACVSSFSDEKDTSFGW